MPSGADSAAVFVDVDCSGIIAPAGDDFDLLHIFVERRQSQFHLDARYSGPTAGHNILIRFDLGGSMYTVDAELFEDGKGVAQVLDTLAADSLFLDPPQVITLDQVSLVVRNDQLERIGGSPLTISVSLKVDGSEVEVCP